MPVWMNNSKSKSMTYLFIAIAAYVFIVAFMYIKQRDYIYFPNRQPTPISAALQDFQKISVMTEDGVSLSALYKPPQHTDKPVIVFFHGNGGDIGDRVYRPQPYISEGYGFLLAEYRGFWGNEGIPSEQGLYADAQAYMEWLIHEQSVPPEQIVVFGESLGTGVSVEMAVRYPDIKALLLLAPFTSLADVGQVRMRYLPVRWLMKDRYNNLAKINNIRTSLLVLHGRKDDIVPFGFGENLFMAAPEPKEMAVFDQGNHVDLLDHGEAQRILRFLKELK